MDIALTILKWIMAPIVAMVLTILFMEPMRERLVPVLSRFGSKKEKGINGIWRATFYCGVPELTYVEYIEITSSLGIYVGRIIPHADNYSAVKEIEGERPVRVRGTLKDNTFFSGQWLHPIRRSHHIGTFDLLVDRSNTRMEGRWLGFSESRRVIESNRWIWARVK